MVTKSKIAGEMSLVRQLIHSPCHNASRLPGMNLFKARIRPHFHPASVLTFQRSNIPTLNNIRKNPLHPPEVERPTHQDQQRHDSAWDEQIPRHGVGAEQRGPEAFDDPCHWIEAI